MSHITKVQTQMTDLNTVARALEFLELPFTANAEGSEVRMYNSSDVFKAPIVINLPEWAIGIDLNKDGLAELKADSYAWNEVSKQRNVAALAARRRVNQDVFGGILQQAYNIIRAKDTAEAEGHELIIDSPDENGVVHARVRTQV
jgi:hypothetical protein